MTSHLTKNAEPVEPVEPVEEVQSPHFQGVPILSRRPQEFLQTRQRGHLRVARWCGHQRGHPLCWWQTLNSGKCLDTAFHPDTTLVSLGKVRGWFVFCHVLNIKSGFSFPLENRKGVGQKHSRVSGAAEQWVSLLPVPWRPACVSWMTALWPGPAGGKGVWCDWWIIYNPQER